MSRFDYVKYDDHAVKMQGLAKDMVTTLEEMIDSVGHTLDPQTDKSKVGRAKSHAIAKLEEVYMWIGKAIRDDQIARAAAAKVNVDLQEERCDE